jgi:hypothetical protein
VLGHLTLGRGPSSDRCLTPRLGVFLDTLHVPLALLGLLATLLKLIVSGSEGDGAGLDLRSKIGSLGEKIAGLLKRHWSNMELRGYLRLLTSG